MIDDIVDGLRCVSDLGSCCDTAATRWYGRTRPVRITMISNRVARRLCIPLGIAALVLLGDGGSTAGWVMLALAIGIPVVTVAVEMLLQGRGLIVLGPARWPPGDTSPAAPGWCGRKRRGRRGRRGPPAAS